MTICHDEMAGGYGNRRLAHVELIPSRRKVMPAQEAACINFSTRIAKSFRRMYSDVIVLRRSAVNWCSQLRISNQAQQSILPSGDIMEQADVASALAATIGASHKCSL